MLVCNHHETIPLLGDNYLIIFETGDEKIEKYYKSSSYFQ
jgi:hypothetical protein